MKNLGKDIRVKKENLRLLSVLLFDDEEMKDCEEDINLNDNFEEDIQFGAGFPNYGNSFPGDDLNNASYAELSRIMQEKIGTKNFHRTYEVLRLTFHMFFRLRNL